MPRMKRQEELGHLITRGENQELHGSVWEDLNGCHAKQVEKVNVEGPGKHIAMQG